MARTNDYPRWRFYTMQALMWVVLLAAVGVAALVSRVRSGAAQVKLGEPVHLETTSVRLPAGWRSDYSDADGQMIRVIERRVRPQWARTVLVQEHDPGLLERFVTSVGAGDARGGRKPTTIDFGDAKGTLSVTRTRVPFSPDGEVLNDGSGVEFVGITAQGELPSGHRVWIFLHASQLQQDSDKPADPENVELVKQIAASVKLLHPPDAGPQLQSK